jgi:DNA-binding NarL/FixJ family response regulator
MTAGNPKQKVLLVDDHPLVCEWLGALLNQQPDLRVCAQAGSGAAALEAAAATQPDLAVVDISLQDASGIELIKDLKRTCPNLAVLVLSMHEESLYAERALRAGAKGYVMKREATGKIIEAIRTVLAGKFYLSDGLAQAIARQFVAGKPLTARSPLEQLSDRELEVFHLLGQGLGTRRIAELLGVSVKTVQTHCARIKAKLQLDSASALAREAIRHYEALRLGPVDRLP